MAKVFSYGLDLKTYQVHRFFTHKAKWNWIAKDPQYRQGIEDANGAGTELGRLALNAVRMFNREIAMGKTILFPAKLPDFYIRKIGSYLLKRTAMKG